MTRKLTIEEMNNLAEKKGGKCLSTEYINVSTNLKWECENGHIWEAKPKHIKDGHWCPICAGNAPLTIEEMNKLAEEKGGKCLSTIYINTRTKLKWQCKEGHIWEATPDNIKRGTWCPVCARNVPLNIEEMHKLAEKRGGKCLSTMYINSQTKLKWQCEEGHIWEAIPNNIKIGSWCPTCRGKSINDADGDKNKMNKNNL